MGNIVAALGAGVATFALLYLTGLLKLGEAVVPGILVTFVTYFILARRTFKKVEKVAVDAAKCLQSAPPKFDLAIATLHKAYAYGRQQIGVRSQIDTQIGMIYFLQQEFNKALPYLQRAKHFGHWVGTAMLAVIYYKKKDIANMRSTMDLAVKRGKRQGLAWNLYAYLLSQIGDRQGAQKVLVDGLKHTKDDPKVKDALLALQNGKKIKMRAYKEQWYQFHLERPPVEMHPASVGGRAGKLGKIARRGRW